MPIFLTHYGKRKLHIWGTKLAKLVTLATGNEDGQSRAVLKWVLVLRMSHYDSNLPCS